MAYKSFLSSSGQEMAFWHFQLMDVCKYSPTVFSCKDCVFAWRQKDNMNSRSISWWQRHLKQEVPAGPIEEDKVRLLFIIPPGAFRLWCFEAKCTCREKVLQALPGGFIRGRGQDDNSFHRSLDLPTAAMLFRDKRGVFFLPKVIHFVCKAILQLFACNVPCSDPSAILSRRTTKEETHRHPVEMGEDGGWPLSIFSASRNKKSNSEIEEQRRMRFHSWFCQKGGKQIGMEGTP